MQLRHRQIFTTIRTEGAILPADLLQRINERDAQLKGLLPDDYHLAGGLKLNEAINQSWNRMFGAWAVFQNALRSLPAHDAGTTTTREKWLLPLFQELGYGRLQSAKAVEVDGKGYPISHLWQQTPIHLVSAKVKLDERTAGVAGASRVSPHGLVQELLNRSDAHLWGFVSNGMQLRILRDNVSLTRQAYVEFDLEAMMNGELYPDFALLWLLCHESRVNAEKPQECWLERWSKAAQEQGTRALEQLRTGVEEAIKALGRGFLSHPTNQTLFDKLRSGVLDKQDYYRQLLRLVYRLLFLFVSEDRDLLFAPATSEATRERYARFYSVAQLRRLAERRLGTRHHDLYHGLRLVMQKLGNGGCSELGLPALGSFLFSDEAIADLSGCDLANHDLLDAVRALAFITDRHGRRAVDYKNLRSEELGSVYEALLELHPVINAEARQFNLDSASGNERKTTGSYYTPDSLVQCLLDSALEPVIAEARKQPDPEAALLRLKVVDPACGSGHFLIAAAHRLSKHLAAVRTGDDEPAPEAIRKALRDVIGHSIYGVDINPMAVELCKVSLWMEALEPGKPLTFLEHRIQCGNSLIGAIPALLERGIPDEAFKPIEGDDKTVCAEYRRYNKKYRESGQRNIFEMPIKLGNLAASILELDALDDDKIENIRQKEKRYEELVRSQGYEFNKLWADAWCAAFVWKKVSDRNHPAPITEELFRKIEQSPFHIKGAHHEIEIHRLARQYQFFHWHLAFPDVFSLWSGEWELGREKGVGSGEREGKQSPTFHSPLPTSSITGWRGGFDIVLGNPPWERIKLQEKEWFAQRNPEIANALNAATRQRKIKELIETDPTLHEAFLDDRRKAEGESHLARNSGRFPLCGTGDINTYAIFAETNRTLINERGRVGCIVPSGIAFQDTTKAFFQALMETRTLAAMYSFFEIRKLFPATDSREPFCLLTITGKDRPAEVGAEFVFSAESIEDLHVEQRRFTLSAEEIKLLNPNTRTCPVFRTKRDAELTKAIYARVPVVIREGVPDGNAWGIEFKRMIDMANDSGLFRTREDLLRDGWRLTGNIFSKDGEEYLPLYEAKMLHHFDHRFGDYDDKPEDSQNTSLPDVSVERLQNPAYVVQPRYWVPRDEVIYKITRVPPDVLKAYRDGNEDKLRMAVMHWLSAWDDAHQSEVDWDGLSTKERETRCERRTRAHQFLSAHPLTAAECLELRHGWEELHTKVVRLIEVKAPRWLLGWRDICRSTDERTVIASVLPRAGVGHTSPLMFCSPANASLVTCLHANLTSFVLDYCARQKIGGTHLTYGFLNQLPVLGPTTYSQFCSWHPSQTLREWLSPRMLELTYTAHDLQGFAEDCDYTGEPFRWDEGCRFLLRCELDAAYFHLYGIAREDVGCILDTFPIVKRKDEAQRGEYRTKRVIMEIYDEMRQAMKTGGAYRTRLSPSPANGWTPSESTQSNIRVQTVQQTDFASIDDKHQGDLSDWPADSPQQIFNFSVLPEKE